MQVFQTPIVRRFELFFYDNHDLASSTAMPNPENQAAARSSQGTILSSALPVSSCAFSIS